MCGVPQLILGPLVAAGADRVLAMDLHSGQCVGYFDIPVDHVYGDSVILDYLASKRISTGDLVSSPCAQCLQLYPDAMAVPLLVRHKDSAPQHR